MSGWNSILIIAFAVIIVISLFILIYRAIYKRGINRALEGNPPRTHLTEPLSFIQTVFILFGFGLGCVGMYYLNSMDTTLANQQLALSNLNIRLNSLQSQLNQLEDDFAEYVEGESLVVEHSTEWTDADGTEKTMDLTVSFTLSAIPIGADIFLVVTDLDDYSSTQRFPVSGTTLDFEGTLTLSMTKRYQISVLVEDGTLVQGEDLEDIDLPELLLEGMYGYVHEDYADPDAKIQVTLAHNAYGLEDLSLTSVILKVYASPESSVLVTTALDITDSRMAPDWLLTGWEQFQVTTDYTLNETTSEYFFVFSVTDGAGNTWEIPAD